MSGAVVRQIMIAGVTYTGTFKFGSVRMADEILPGGMDGKSGSIAKLSALFWAVLQPKHRITREGSDALIDEAGPDAVGEFIREGMAAYQGDPEDAPADEGNVKKTVKKKGS